MVEGGGELDRGVREIKEEVETLDTGLLSGSGSLCLSVTLKSSDNCCGWVYYMHYRIPSYHIIHTM